MTAILTPAARRDLARLRSGERFVLCFGPWEQLHKAGLVTGDQHHAEPVAVKPPMIDDYRADAATRRRNQDRQATAGDVADVCFLCERPLSEKALASAWYVEHAFSGEILAVDDPRSGTDESQGCFPLGSECAKRLPKALRAKAVR